MPALTPVIPADAGIFRLAAEPHCYRATPAFAGVTSVVAGVTQVEGRVTGNGYLAAPTPAAPFGTTAIVQSFSGFRYFAAVACNSAGVIVVKSLTSV